MNHEMIIPAINPAIIIIITAISENGNNIPAYNAIALKHNPLSSAIYIL
jgi:hypothetical protein